MGQLKDETGLGQMLNIESIKEWQLLLYISKRLTDTCRGPTILYNGSSLNYNDSSSGDDPPPQIGLRFNICMIRKIICLYLPFGQVTPFGRPFFMPPVL